MTASDLRDMVRQAWSDVPAPAEDDMKIMAWAWGESAAHAFVGVAPIAVDIRSPGFHAATPLLELPARAAAAYLGTYLLSLLQSLEFQEAVGLFDDVITRAHTLTCLTDKRFWDEVIRIHLSAQCREVVVRVVRFLAASRDALALGQEEVETLLQLATTAGEER